MYTLDIKDLLQKMEDMYREQEEEFEFTKIFYNLQKVCDVHGTGQKDLELMRYICPFCNKPLKKDLII